MVFVIYECDIPVHISCSSLLLQRFITEFDDDKEQYLTGIMKRKNLSRVSAPSNKHGRGNHNQEHKCCVVRQKVISLKQEHSQQPSRINPFKKKLHHEVSTRNKENIKFTTNVTIREKVSKNHNKKQCTIDYFFGSKGM